MRFGFEAIGGMLAGLVAARFGAPATLGIAAAMLLLYLIVSIGWRLRARQLKS
jgi:hypothetical protein